MAGFDLAMGAKSLFVLYLMISSNYLGSLFGCRVQQLFENNMLVKHTVGFLTLYLFVSLLEGNGVVAPGKQLWQSGVIYAAFFMSTKMNFKFWLPFIILMGIVYTLYIVKDALYGGDSLLDNQATDPVQEKRTRKIKEVLTEDRIGKAQRAVVVGALLLMVAGFLVYLGEKKLELGKDFQFSKFVFGNPTCTGGPPIANNIPLTEKVKAAFQ